MEPIHSPPAPDPEQEPEPEPKKLKMCSTTTDDDDEITHNPSDRKPRYKRRKIAIFLAYCGVGYQGMQKNPGAKTIEGELEEALYHSGAVPESDRGIPKRFDWARAARTDKGVSAVGQVVSGRFYVDPPGLVDRLNSILPLQIRIFGYKRVTASFNAKKFCDRRRYVYLIPVFSLDPNAHRDRESVLASVGSENELVKCLECSERGRKVVGVMGRRNCESRVTEGEAKGVTEPSTITVNSDVVEVSNTETGLEVEKSGLVMETRITSLEEKKLELNITSVNDNGEEKGMLANGVGFHYGEKERERFNGILKHFVGTHNFHNFTTRTKAEDPSARRYIVSFDANTVVAVGGMDFVKCEVVGQSFMLHQIRKMIGLAVAVMRNCTTESFIDAALRQDVNINVPTAPEVGLYLDECLFTSYNQKWKDTHEEISMKDNAEEAEDFKMKQIYSHIAATEQNEGVVALWLHSLNRRNYPDLWSSEANGESTTGESLQVGDMLSK